MDLSPSTLGLAASIAGTLFLGYCVYFDQQRRKDPLFKKKLRELQEVWKVLTVLKNNNQPMIRKRQLMRLQLGDYRTLMANEEKKLAKMTKKITISQPVHSPKATFLRKSAFQTTGDSSFRFDFKLTSDDLDSRNAENIDDAKSEHFSENGHTQHTYVENINQSSAGDMTKTTTSDASSKNFVADKSSASNTPKDFKFSFSKDEFKFNFSS